MNPNQASKMSQVNPYSVIESLRKQVEEQKAKIERLTHSYDQIWDGMRIEQERCVELTRQRDEAMKQIPTWLPIDTAPKDSDILLSDERNVSPGCWVGRYFAWGYSNKPTHWMPMPSAAIKESNS